MLCSSVDKNWMRVEIMHSVAKGFLNIANEIKESHGEIKPLFDLRHYMYEQKESCIVGMIKAWCVVTLESMVNQAVAENLSNKTDAISAIEFPGDVLKKFKFNKKANSELSKKLIIVNDGYEGIEKIVNTADEIAELRNLIVHDKPYKYTDLGEGDVIIEEYRKRGNSDNNHHKFNDLSEFYRKCDQIAQFLMPKIETTTMFQGNVNFSKLLNG